MVKALSRRPVDSATISRVRRDDHSVGEVEVFGDDGGAVVGIEADDDAAGERLASDVGAAHLVDDHVAEVGRRQLGEIGDGDDGFAVVAQYLPVFGRDDQQ